ncbi:MAG: hypothetical protein AAGD25_21320 [Cyanobacteria bacterium P01_F01_bin.150]
MSNYTNSITPSVLTQKIIPTALRLSTGQVTPSTMRSPSPVKVSVRETSFS